MLEDICDSAISIRFPKTEDTQSNENRSLSIKRPTHPSFQKVKCYKCYGTGAKNCSQCENTQYILRTHPLAMLLNSVLVKKLELDREKECKEEQQFEEVYPIKEEEEDADQKKLTCSYCQSQCDQPFYYCSICPCLHVCETCERKNISHQHEMTKSKFSSACNIDLSLADELKKCFNCNKNIQNCYSACKTCKEQGLNFWVCDLCSDSKAYAHEPNHICEPVIDYHQFNHLETVSQEILSEDKSIQLQKDEIQEGQCFEQDNKENFMGKKNSSIDNYVETENDPCPQLSYNLFREKSKKTNDMSRVRFEIEDGLFSSYELTGDKQSCKSRVLLSKVAEHEDRTDYRKGQILRSTFKQNSQRNQNQFCFTGYKCDICGIEPIRNVRYHCTTCEDFDFCQQCFETCLKTHDHITFDKIDHQETKRKAITKIFQLRDTNLRATNLLPSTTYHTPLRFSNIHR